MVCQLAPGCAPTLEELREHLLAAGLAVQKAPERLVIVADLPRTASGKVQRFVLREELRHELCDEPRQPDTDADVASPGPARG